MKKHDNQKRSEESAPPQSPPALGAGTTQEVSRAEILEYLEKAKKDGQPR